MTSVDYDEATKLAKQHVILLWVDRGEQHRVGHVSRTVRNIQPGPPLAAGAVAAVAGILSELHDLELTIPYYGSASDASWTQMGDVIVNGQVVPATRAIFQGRVYPWVAIVEGI